MPFTGFVMYVGLLTTMINAKAIGAECESRSIQLPTGGIACETQEHTNISVTEHRRCSMACIRNKECQATIYDSPRLVCILLPEPCFRVERYTGFVYQVFQHQCTQWVPESDDVPGYWTNEGNGQSYVVRRYIGSDLVVGKLTNRLHVISPRGDHIQGGNYEELVVDGFCRVTWVPYDSTTGQPIPTGTLIGGFLSATNTPVYVSKLAGGFVGWYNPLNGRAVSHGGIRNDTTLELMVVQPPTAIPWTHSVTYKLL